MNTHKASRHLPLGEAHTPGSHLGTPAAASDADRAQQPAHLSSHLSSLLAVSHRLRPRDYAIASLLDEHTTLTTEQIAAVLFDNITTCRHRLHLLRHIHFVDRFIRNRPRQPNPTCWVPGLLSARFIALARDASPPTARGLRERQDRVYASPTLTHLLEANQFFIDLLAHARRDRDADLTRWWSERTTAAAFGQRVHPDGHGVWTTSGRSVGFFLELDRGTESLGTLIGKLAAYRRLRAHGGPGYPVLFVLPGPVREHNLHRRLTDQLDPAVPVATATAGASRDPAGAVWRLAGTGQRRLRLVDLPSDRGQPGPLNPEPPHTEHHPLRLISAQ